MKLPRDPVVWVTLAMLASILAFCCAAAVNTARLARQLEAARRTIGRLEEQTRVLEGENRWSTEDRAELHESQGEIRGSLGRLEDFAEAIRKRAEARKP